MASTFAASAGSLSMIRVRSSAVLRSSPVSCNSLMATAGIDGNWSISPATMARSASAGTGSGRAMDEGVAMVPAASGR